MLEADRKKMLRDAFVRRLTQDDELFTFTTEDIVWTSAFVELFLDDLCVKYSGLDLEKILGDEDEMLSRYIVFLQTRLEIGNFKPLH